jgi:uncharacterized protein (DUF433 family)
MGAEEFTMILFVLTKQQPVPLKMDEHGYVRVIGTRVGLDVIVYSFREGSTPEEIVQQYPTVKLADAYSVIAYYLREREDVDKYIQEQEEESDRMRAEIEARFPPDGLRERLLARKNAKKRQE